MIVGVRNARGMPKVIIVKFFGRGNDFSRQASNLLQM
jgi:hypothetical protein